MTTTTMDITGVAPWYGSNRTLASSSTGRAWPERLLRDYCEAVFHPLNAWSARQWACCVFGESGELVGELKKLWWRNDGSVAAVAGEAADVLIYLDLLGAVSGYSLLDESSSTIASEAADVIARMKAEQHPAVIWKDEDVVAGFGSMIAALLNTTAAPVHAHRRLCSIAVAYQVFVIAHRVGFDIEHAIVEKFNAVSDRRGCEIKLAPGVTA